MKRLMLYNGNHFSMGWELAEKEMSKNLSLKVYHKQIYMRTPFNCSHLFVNGIHGYEIKKRPDISVDTYELKEFFHKSVLVMRGSYA